MVIQLIKEEIKNKWLMYAFQDLGLDCSFFIIDISHIVLKCIGITDKSDKINYWYYSLINRAVGSLSATNLSTTIDNWSQVIYSELLEQRLRQRMQEVME